MFEKELANFELALLNLKQYVERQEKAPPPNKSNDPARNTVLREMIDLKRKKIDILKRMHSRIESLAAD